ncbi:MAG: hypothetical protein QF863_10140, partial [Pseudomonadales bacterium]|nr:hypothetical protein [Pseudomonadales bacterium]
GGFIGFAVWVLRCAAPSQTQKAAYWRSYGKQPKVKDRPEYIKRRIKRYEHDNQQRPERR